MHTFSEIYDLAIAKQGSIEALEKRLPKILSSKALTKKTMNEYLASMSWRIFAAGLSRQVIDNKWDDIFKAYHEFDIEYLANLSDEELEAYMQDERVIRHWGKIIALRHNAQTLYELQKQGVNFGEYLANWDVSDTLGLWQDLTKQFKQLGGNSGPYFLRIVGKDTFMFSSDVIQGLKQFANIYDEIKYKNTKLVAQEAFNTWHDESKIPMAHISMTIALAADG